MWHFQKVVAFIIVSVINIILMNSANAQSDDNCTISMQCLKPADADSKEVLINKLVDQGFTREEIMNILAICKR